MELKTKASNALRNSGASTKTTVKIFPQEDFELLEELRQIPLEQLTGRQLEELYGIFYRKHAEKNMRYMIAWELRILAHFESLRKEEDTTESSREWANRSTTSEPSRFETEESMASTKYVPTTEDVLNMYDKLRQEREQAATEESHSGGSRASPRPETPSPALGKRTLGESPSNGYIITSVTANDFKAMEEEITAEMATRFERQVDRLPMWDDNTRFFRPN